MPHLRDISFVNLPTPKKIKKRSGIKYKKV